MRAKILVLGLVCLFFISGCKKQLPTSPNLSELLGLPVIDYFTANYQHTGIWIDGRVYSYYILSWSVTDARVVSIDQGIGEVSATDTEGVEIRMATTYTLTAENDKGQKTASCEAVFREDQIGVSLTEFEITTIPEMPIFTYYPDSDTSKSTFTIVITETGGEVGGAFDGEIRSFIYQQPGCWTLHLLEWRTIEALGTVMYDVDLEVKCRTGTVQVYIDGIDESGRRINKLVDISFIWAN